MNALEQLRAARKPRHVGGAVCGHSREVTLVLVVRERADGKHLSSKAVTVCAECALATMADFEQRWAA